MRYLRALKQLEARRRAKAADRSPATTVPATPETVRMLGVLLEASVASGLDPDEGPLVRKLALDLQRVSPGWLDRMIAAETNETNRRARRPAWDELRGLMGTLSGRCGAGAKP